MQHLLESVFMIFLMADLSLAEARVVYARSKDPRLIELARTKPWEFDLHKFNASLIFKKPEDQVTKLERYVSKRIVHASHYGAQAVKASDALLQEGFVFTPEECEGFQKAYLDAMPGVVAWKQAVIMQVINARQLTDSWGWTIKFPHERLDEALYRRAFAWFPQGDVGKLTNMWGLIPLYYEIKYAGRWNANVKSAYEEEFARQFIPYEAILQEAAGGQALRSRINLQVHDEVIVSCPKEEIYEVACFLRACLERSRSYDGVDLTIPVEFAAGRRWMKEVEWKRFPSSKEEFMDAVKPLL